MIGCAAGHDVDSRKLFELFFAIANFIKLDRFTNLNSTCHGIAQSFGLLMDFFQGEVIITALFSQFGRPSDFIDPFGNGLKIIIIKLRCSSG